MVFLCLFLGRAGFLNESDLNGFQIKGASYSEAYVLSFLII